MAPLRKATLPAANKIFVDREDPQRFFERAVFSIPSDRAMLRVFYGPGGEGKTALCRELMRKTDKSVEPSYAFLRRALVSLHGRATIDPDLLLVWTRNAFASSGVVFPCFDLAFALTWAKTRGEEALPLFTNPWLGRVSKTAQGAVSEAASAGASWLHSDGAKQLLGDAVGEVPGLGFILKYVGGWVIDKTKRVYLERTYTALQELKRAGELKPDYELSAMLPWMLAQDFNYHLAKSPGERFVLFIDEYERVFDQGGVGARWSTNPFDIHMRNWIAETNGLLVVFFSREKLPWGGDPDWREDLRDDSYYLLGGLADKDADEFLKAVPIMNHSVRQGIIEGARESSDKLSPVYPLMLDLQVEHWRELTAKGEVLPDRFTIVADSFEARCIEMVRQVLRDYGDPLQTTIERLSVARRFDRGAFEHVVTTFGTALPLDTFERIAELSFVMRADEGFISFHGVVAQALRKTLSEEKWRTSLDALLEYFLSQARVTSHFDLTLQKVAALFEAAYLRRQKGIFHYVPWLSRFTEPLIAGALYAPAALLWQEAVHAVEEGLGANHPDTATSLNDLAVLLQKQGNYAEAQPLFERALAIRKLIFGEEDPITAVSLNNFAAVLQAQGHYAEAQPLYQRALAICDKRLGDHPDTATSLNNLAAVLQSRGDLAQAQPLYERALAIRDKVLGTNHPDTARSLNALAGILEAQQDHKRAQPLYERALKIAEEMLGTDHPDTATIVYDLAGLLESIGDYSESLRLYERSLAIREKVLGFNHPETGMCVHNMAYVLEGQGDYAAAQLLYERALSISEKALGADHPNTRMELELYELQMQMTGDRTGEQPVYERALAIRQRGCEVEHNDIATSLNNWRGCSSHVAIILVRRRCTTECWQYVRRRSDRIIRQRN